MQNITIPDSFKIWYIEHLRHVQNTENLSNTIYTELKTFFNPGKKKLEAYSEPYQIFAMEPSARTLCNPDIFRTFPYSEPEEYT